MPLNESCIHSVLSIEVDRLRPVINVRIQCLNCEQLVPSHHVRDKIYERTGPGVWVMAPQSRRRL